MAGVNGKFLDKPVKEWVMDSLYIKLKLFMGQMAVVNDASERGIKLIQEYVDSARGEELRQDIMTVSKQFKNRINSKNMTKGCCYLLFLDAL